MHSEKRPLTIGEVKLIDGDRRRLGRFLVSWELIEDHPEEALRLMGSMLVVRCEFRYDVRALDYTALSPMFDFIDFGELPKEYTIRVHLEIVAGSRRYSYEAVPV